jgi:hypothetical protein
VAEDLRRQGGVREIGRRQSGHSGERGEHEVGPPRVSQRGKFRILDRTR